MEEAAAAKKLENKRISDEIAARARSKKYIPEEQRVYYIYENDTYRKMSREEINSLSEEDKKSAEQANGYRDQITGGEYGKDILPDIVRRVDRINDSTTVINGTSTTPRFTAERIYYDENGDVVTDQERINKWESARTEVETENKETGIS